MVSLDLVDRYQGLSLFLSLSFTLSKYIQNAKRVRHQNQKTAELSYLSINENKK